MTDFKFLKVRDKAQGHARYLPSVFVSVPLRKTRYNEVGITACFNLHKDRNVTKEGWAYKETDREKDRQTERQTGRETDRQTNRQTDRQTPDRRVGGRNSIQLIITLTLQFD